MTTHARGVSALSGDKDPWIWSPSMVSALIDRIDQRAARLDRSIRGAAASLAVPWVAEWSKWLGEWRTYAASVDFLDRTWGGTPTLLQAREAELARWEADYLARGGKVVGPVIVPPPPDGLGVWSKIGIGVVSGLAVYAIVALLRPRGV